VVRLAVLVTVPLGIIERGGAGVHFNAHFEAAITLSLSAALAFKERISTRVNRIVAGSAAIALFAAGFVIEAREVRQFSASKAAWDAMEQRISVVPGAVACESQALCFWAGQPFGIDFFLYSQRARETGDTHSIDRALAAHRFAAVQIDANLPPGNPDRATDPILRRLAATMHPVFIDASGRSLLMRRQ
ncbi:MAG: hypothetical protein M3N02_10015, partial [Pseudomonadota bacterium]|nr:hypothetical protein [Pseudomonadota bacterium]